MMNVPRLYSQRTGEAFALEILAEFFPPLPGPAAIGRGDETVVAQRLAVLLAFRDEDNRCLNDFAQAV